MVHRMTRGEMMSDYLMEALLLLYVDRYRILA